MCSVEDNLLENRRIFLYDELNLETYTRISKEIIYLSTVNHVLPISLFVGTVGGSGDYCLGIYDLIQSIPNPVHTYCLGHACSAGAFLFAAGEKGHRHISPHSRIMLHFSQISFEGPNTELRTYAQQFNQMDDTFTEILVKHTGQPARKIKNDLKNDFFLVGKEAIDYGVADCLILPCK